MSTAHGVSLQPVIKLFNSTLDFVTLLVNSHAAPSVLIVCGTADHFLETLLRDLELLSVSSEGATEPSLHQEHMLVTPTLHLLAKSQSLRIAYVPSLPHLRAYLATFSPKSTISEGQATFEKAGSLSPTMAILNPLALHRATGDLTAQGLSRTFSLAVEAAGRESMQLLMTELCQVPDAAETLDPNGTSTEESSDPWEEKVPLLNSSLRFRGDERAWAGKTVKISHIASRWCSIQGR